MADVYRFTTPDSQEHAWHGSLAHLQSAHPGAAVNAHLVLDELGQGTWEPHSVRDAKAAERKAAEPVAEAEEAVEEKPAKKAAK